MRIAASRTSGDIFRKPESNLRRDANDPHNSRKRGPSHQSHRPPLRSTVAGNPSSSGEKTQELLEIPTHWRPVSRALESIAVISPSARRKICSRAFTENSRKFRNNADRRAGRRNCPRRAVSEHQTHCLSLATTTGASLVCSLKRQGSESPRPLQTRRSAYESTSRLLEVARSRATRCTWAGIRRSLASTTFFAWGFLRAASSFASEHQTQRSPAWLTWDRASRDP